VYLQFKKHIQYLPEMENTDMNKYLYNLSFAIGFEQERFEIALARKLHIGCYNPNQQLIFLRLAIDNQLQPLRI